MNGIPSWAAELEVDEFAWLSLLVKTTLVLVVARLLHAALWRANPRWRRLLWRTTALGLVLVTVSFLFPPLVSWAILPAGVSDAITKMPKHRHPAAFHSPSAARKVRDFDFSPRSVLARQARPRPNGLQSDSLAPASAGAPVPRQAVANATQPNSKAAQPPEASSSIASAPQLAGLPVWVAAIWCAGAVLIVTRTVVGMRRLAAVRNRATAVPAWLTDEAAALAGKLGCTRSPEVLQTAEIASPCIMGVRRPVILLPGAQCDRQYGHELPAILAHEIAHVLGHDVVWQLLLHAVGVLWWFHPLAWRMRSAHAAACDAVCDAIAANHVGDVAAYGRTLARLAIRVMTPNAATGMAMAQASSVRRRIESLKRRVFPFGISRGPAVCAVFFGLSLFLLLGVFALARAQADPPGDPPPKQTAQADANKNGPAPADGDKSDPDFSGLIVHVSDEAGQPVAGAELRFRGRINRVPLDRRLTTDEDGVVKFAVAAGARFDYLRMQCEKPGLVPVYYNWLGENRSIELPKRLDLRLSPGQAVSGVVQNETGQPIAGAVVKISMPITWPKLDSWVFHGAELKTDEAGRWHWSSAPADLSPLGVRVTHPDYIDGFGTFQGRDSLAVLKQGLSVSGRVTDADGKPIRDAVARAGFDHFGTNEPVSHTDENGRFVLANCKPGKSLVTIQADGYAPQFQELTIGTANAELQFKLAGGHVTRVRVLDVEGNPIQGAFFCTDTWRGYRSLALRVETDAEGRAEWKSAPPDAVLCDIFKTGYMSIRRLPVQAGNDEVVITLPDELIITGKVTDAVSGQPIGEFGVREGMVFQNSDQVYWSRDEAPKYSGGTYRFRFDEPKREHLLEFVADGYKPAQSRRFKSTDGQQTLDIELQPGSGPGGVVLLPGGEPAAGAEVGMATKQTSAYLSGGRFHRSGNGAEIVTTDKLGRFTLTPRDGKSFYLIVVHDVGYAQVTSDEFAKSNEIKLRPWGHIEGRVMLGREPDTNRTVSFWPKREDSYGFVFTNDYSTKTDALGHFRFDRVIPGPGYVARVVIVEFINSWQNTPSWQVPVEVPSDDTVSVMIGGTGRPVTGLVKLDRQPDVAVDWTTNEPVTINLQEEKTEPRTYFRCAASIDSQGRFRIPDVPAGKYKLTIPVNNPPTPNACGAGDAIGRATLDFVVPPMTDNRSDEPLDLGTVTATLFDTLEVGEEAPDFVLAGLSGGTVRLSKLRGKLVVLDFWATWCGPCLAEMPALGDIQKQFGGNPRFAMISLACDQQPEPARRYVEENALNWTHAFAGAAGAGIGGVAAKYTVRSLPGTFLVGPDGLVLAKNLRGDQLKQAVAAALADDKLFEAAKNVTPPARFPVVRFKPDTNAPAPAEKPAILVMDDADPDYDEKGYFQGKEGQPRHDALRAYSNEGAELWAIADLNTCQSVSGAEPLAVDYDRARIYATEQLGNRVTAIDFRGRKLWQVEKIDVDTLAVDPKTGYLWASGGSSLNQGETVVLDAEGNEVAAYPFRGIDLAYDPKADAFWLAGYEIMQLDRKGQVRFRFPVEGWCHASMALDPTDGGAWLAERKHPDVADSHNRLWHVDAKGKVTRKVELGDFSPMRITRDPTSGDLWLCGYPRQLRRVTANGDLREPLPIEANSIAFGRADSGPWVTTETELLKLDADGKTLWRHPFQRPSMQIWLTAF